MSRSLSDIVLAPSDNEMTSYPIWAIVSKGSFGRYVFQAGVWFTRQEAEDHLKARAYRFPKKAFVFCYSGHDSADVRDIYELAKAGNVGEA